MTLGADEIVITFDWKGQARLGGCLGVLREYCMSYAYPDYDRVGIQYAEEPNVLNEELLHAMNMGMRARSARRSWGDLLGMPLDGLEEVPTNVDLVECSDGEWADVRERLRVCYECLASRSGITDMAATKMLHLKRPRLVAISDSYIRSFLHIGDPKFRYSPSNRGEWYAERALDVADVIRAVGQQALETLERLQSLLTNEPEPIQLSKARILDIRIWWEGRSATTAPGKVRL